MGTAASKAKTATTKTTTTTTTTQNVNDDPGTSDPPVTRLDASAFPHLLDLVLAHASPSSLLPLRLVSHHVKRTVDRRLCGMVSLLPERQDIIYGPGASRAVCIYTQDRCAPLMRYHRSGKYYDIALGSEVVHIGGEDDDEPLVVEPLNAAVRDALQHIHNLYIVNPDSLRLVQQLGLNADTIQFFAVSGSHMPSQAVTWPPELFPKTLLLPIDAHEPSAPLKVPSGVRRLVLRIHYVRGSDWDPDALSIDLGNTNQDQKPAELVVVCKMRFSPVRSVSSSGGTEGAGRQLDALISPLLGVATQLTVVDPPKGWTVMPGALAMNRDEWERSGDPAEHEWARADGYHRSD